MKNKTVIVTGASSGIGEATAYAFAQQGANVVLVARSEDKLEAIRKQCETNGVQALVVKCDVSIEADCRNMVQQTIARFGGIDVLINNAGISMRALFDDCDIDVLRRVMDINFWGTVYCTKYALPHLLRNKGSVVAVSSLAGISGLPGRTGYAASKFAIGGFMQSLRIENLKNDLHVGVIYPGYTATNIRYAALLKNGEQQKCSPLNEKGLVSADQVAGDIVNMVLTRRRINILTVQGKLLKWLNGVWPSLVDRTIYKVVSKEKDSPFH
jgi:short-subunit dehydrogenase